MNEKNSYDDDVRSTGNTIISHHSELQRREHSNFQADTAESMNRKKSNKLRLGAQSVTLLSTLRDPTQLRRHPCAFRKQPLLFVPM